MVEDTKRFKQLKNQGNPKITTIQILQSKPAKWQIMKKENVPQFFVLQKDINSVNLVEHAEQDLPN